MRARLHIFGNVLRLTALVAASLTLGCAGRPPRPTAEFEAFHDFERTVRVAAPTPPIPAPPTPALRKVARRREKPTRIKLKRQPASVAPSLPYTVGERETLSLSFAGINAGELAIRTESLVRVNERPAYVFSAELRSNAMFSLFFRVNDRLTLYFDSERLVPLASTLHLEEGRKLEETRVSYDALSGVARQWRNTLSKDAPLRQENKEWSFAPEAQSLLSTLFYLRSYPIAAGRPVVFPVTHEKGNFLFQGQVLGHPVVETPMGPIQTVEVSMPAAVPELFSATQGELRVWLSDDPRRLVVRVEIPLKHGRVTAQLKELGRHPQ